MPLVVFLRGVNVGGHKTFRPSELARTLRTYDVVNVGAAGTLVVRRPGSRTKFLAELRRRLPFEAEVMMCDGREIARLVREDPFAAERVRPDVVRFVGVLSKRIAQPPALPAAFPSEREWLVRVVGWKGQFVFGLYRRHMKTIGYLGRMDRLLGVRVTVRNWNTIGAIAKVLAG